MQGTVQAERTQAHVHDIGTAMTVHFVQGKEFAVLDTLDKVGVLRFRIRQIGNDIHDVRSRLSIQFAFEALEHLPLRSFDVRHLVPAFKTFAFQYNLTSVFVSIRNLAPDTDGIRVLLRSIYLHFDRVGIVLTQDVLYRVDVVLAHIAQTTAVVIPITTESGMYTMRVVWLVRSRAQPHVIIQFGRNRFRSQVFLAYPEELPSKAGSTGDSHLQWPAQQTAIHQFLQRLDGSTQAIEIVLETEPGIQTENAVVLFHRFHHTLPFANGTGHRLFTPDVLAGLGRFDCHDSMPMRRSGDMNDVYIRVLNQITEIVVCLECFIEFLLTQVHRFLQMVLVYITYRYQATLFIAGKVITASTDTAHTNNTLGELVARCNVIRSAQYLSRYNGEQTDSTHCLEKISSIGSHSILLFRLDSSYFDILPQHLDAATVMDLESDTTLCRTNLFVFEIGHWFPVQPSLHMVSFYTDTKCIPIALLQDVFLFVRNLYQPATAVRFVNTCCIVIIRSHFALPAMHLCIRFHE